MAWEKLGRAPNRLQSITEELIKRLPALPSVPTPQVNDTAA